MTKTTNQNHLRSNQTMKFNLITIKTKAFKNSECFFWLQTRPHSTPKKKKIKKRIDNQCVLTWVDDGSRTHDLRYHKPTF